MRSLPWRFLWDSVCQQHFLVGAVEDILVSGDHAAEFLEFLPRNISGVHFIAVSPDVEDPVLPVVGKLQKFLPQLKQLFHLNVIHRGVEAVQVFLRFKIVGRGNGAGIADAGVFPDDFCHPVVVIDAAAGVCHTDNLVAAKLGKLLPVGLHLIDHRVVVLLDPGMIFGTGAHASTQMCMRELERAIQGGEQVLDLGSGSGILSITAILLGAAHATGVDIDPKAEDIARENAAINQIFADRFTAVTGNVIGDKAMMESLKGHYDVVLANIVADVIIPLSRVVPEFLQEDSIFICSGILNTRLDEVLAALEKNGLQILSSEQQEDWCRVTAALLEA